jgi:hypothetical protein
MLSNLTLRFGPSRRFELTVCVNTLCEMDSLSARFGTRLYNLYFDRRTGQLVADDMLAQTSAPVTDDRGQRLTRNLNAPVSVGWEQHDQQAKVQEVSEVAGSHAPKARARVGSRQKLPMGTGRTHKRASLRSAAEPAKKRRVR